MHAGHDQELPEGSDDREGKDGRYAAGVAEREHEVAECIAEHRADRGECAEADGNHHEHREEGHEDGGEHVGNHALEELFHLPEHGHAEKDREHGRGVGIEHGGYAIDRREGLAGIGCGRDDVHEIRRDEDASHHHAEHLRGAKLLCCRVSEVYRHEVEAGVVDPVVEQVIDLGVGRPHIEHARACDDSDGAKHCCAHHDRDGSDHGLREIVEDCLSDTLCRPGLLLLVVIEVLVDGAASRDAELHDRVVYLRNVLADDDLILATRPLAAEHSLDSLDSVVVGDRFVLQVDSQPCHAVRDACDVVLAADSVEDLCGNAFVVCHLLPPRSERDQILHLLWLLEEAPSSGFGGWMHTKNAPRAIPEQQGTQNLCVPALVMPRGAKSSA